jgi:DNA-binding transcriptional MerR regulator
MNDIYLVKDLARVSGCSIYTIKYYLKIGLISEKGRFPETNFRYFDDVALSRLNLIRQLRKKKKSIEEIRSILFEKVQER